MLEIKFKKTHEDAVIPSKSSFGAAGYDLVAVDNGKFNGIDKFTYDTGIAVEIPNGYVGYLYPRGSVSKTAFILANSTGVIDSDFRGSMKVIFKDPSISSFNIENSYKNTPIRQMPDNSKIYHKGDKIAQLVIMPIPDVVFVEVDSLSPTIRGTGMLGSTGK